MSPETESLIEQVVSANRDLDRRGHIRAHPAWHDLDDQGRADAFEASVPQRRLEAALDPDGLSTTARAVLSRLRR